MRLLSINEIDMEVEVETMGYSAIVYCADMEISLRPVVTYKLIGETNKSLLSGEYIKICSGMIFDVKYP